MKTTEIMAHQVQSNGNCCSRNLIPARVALSILGLLGNVFVYALRINMSMAIVCMVNTTATDTSTSTNSSSETPIGDNCGGVDEDTPLFQGEFHWEKDLQGQILSSFFYGYMVIQVPAGWLAGRYGGKVVYAVGMAFAAVATLLLPICASISVYLVIIMRVVIGLGTGVSFPAMNALWGKWAPPLERSKLLTFCNAGTMLGNILALSISGLLCAISMDGRGGWPLIFYIFGGATLIWLIPWIAFAYDSPRQHPYIKEKEKIYIITSIGTNIDGGREDLSVPWMSIVKSVPMWAILVAHACNNWGSNMILTSLPLYMAEVLKYDITSNGLLSSLPYIVQVVATIIGGQVADCLRAKNILSTTNTRKIFQVISFVGQAAFLIGAGFVTCDQRSLAVALLAIAVGFIFGSWSGYAINHVDIAPQYAGLLFGITNTVGTITGIVAPVLVGKMTPNGLREEWLVVFYITGGIFGVGAIVYALFAKGEQRSWANNQGRRGQGHRETEM